MKLPNQTVTSTYKNKEYYKQEKQMKINEIEERLNDAELLLEKQHDILDAMRELREREEHNKVLRNSIIFSIIFGFIIGFMVGSILTAEWLL